MAASQPRCRIAPLDSLRVIATACVVLLHACVPYATHRMPGLVWPVHDRTDRVVDGLFWGIELFVMPLFLVMSGYFAVGLYRNRGGWGMVRHRFQGLMLPFAFAAVFILPLSLYAWLTGWLIEGAIVPRKLRSLSFEGNIDQDLWGTAHLWFLPYLFLYISLFAGGAALFAGRAAMGGPIVGRPISWFRRGSLAALALIGMGTLLWEPEVVFGFQHAFLPVASKWIYCATYFFGGVWLGYFDSDFHQLRQQWKRLLLLGSGSGAVAVYAGTAMLAGADDVATRLVTAVASVMAAWSLTFGLHGWVMARGIDGGPVVRYLAAASFWIYLAHHSVVALLHVDLKILLPNASPLLKAAVAFSVAVAFCLLVFEAVVRRSWIGRLLGVKPTLVVSSRHRESETPGADPAVLAHPAGSVSQPRPTRNAA